MGAVQSIYARGYVCIYNGSTSPLWMCLLDAPWESRKDCPKHSDSIFNCAAPSAFSWSPEPQCTWLHGSLPLVRHHDVLRALKLPPNLSLARSSSSLRIREVDVVIVNPLVDVTWCCQLQVDSIIHLLSISRCRALSPRQSPNTLLYL